MKMMTCAALCLVVTVAFARSLSDSQLDELLSKLLERRDEIPTPEEETGPAKPSEVVREEEMERRDDDEYEISLSGVGSSELRSQEELTLAVRGLPAAVRSFTYYIDSNAQRDGVQTSSSIKTLALEAHNKVRQLHQDTPDLVWDSGLAKQCETFALQLANANSLYHDYGNFGENLYSGLNPLNSNDLPAHAVQRWYSESFKPTLYNYNNNAFSSARGHFTQVIWSGTKKLGCGAAAFSFVRGPFTWVKTIIVCRYTPGGNYPNKYTVNVNPLISGGSASHLRLNDLIPQSASCVNIGTIAAGCKQDWCGPMKTLCECLKC